MSYMNPLTIFLTVDPVGRYRAHDIAHPSALSLLMMGSWMLHKMNPARYMDDNWPILQRLPRVLAPWRSVFDEDARVLLTMAHAWWDPCKDRVRAGVDIPCFASDFVKTYESEGWTDDEAALMSLGLLLSGSGTTGASINFLIMGCCTNPEAVMLAHEELDKVIGDKRLPTLEDEPNLPYVKAMIKEGLRWRPFSNQGEKASSLLQHADSCFTDYSVAGMPHATNKDDTYKGYRIPKGATIIPNAYSVHQNETRYPCPDRFEPARYLDYKFGAAEASNLKDGTQRDHFAYGAGRRLCAGIHVAETSLFLSISRLLWGFNIEYSKDKTGKSIPIDTLNYDGKSNASADQRVRC